jgi:hypothetical protein
MTLALAELDGGALERSWTVPLPDVVKPLLDDRLGERFRIASVAGAIGEFSWRYETEPRRGALLDAPLAPGASPKTERQSVTVLEGGFVVDVPRATATPVAIDQLAPGRGAIEGRWLPSEDGRQFLSADGRHVLASERNPDGGWFRYTCTIYLREGLRLGEMQAPVSYAPFLVTAGNRLITISGESLRLVDDAYREEPLRISAFLLGSNEPAWEHPVRNVAYRGPYPH